LIVRSLQQEERVPPTDPIVQIDSGRLSATSGADGVTAFKGIPYAKPPIGDLRWRAPQPPEPWAGVRRADTFGPRCVQPSRRENSISYYGPEQESEDCLFLNVWTAAAGAGEKRPVMVWLHGGAFYVGSGAIALFDGAYLANRGTVVVTVNYRLGRLGFLAHPELTRESGFSGNYGLLDQIAALQWVKHNIAAFGGDPDCVTVFGQSAGSISGSLLMASPLAKGLFHRVIGQSGALFGPVAESCNTGDSIQSLAAAERTGFEFARALGARSLAELRARPAREIQFSHRRGGTGSGANNNPSDPARGVFDTNWPIVDGRVLPESPFDLFAHGRQNDVPLLAGVVANEGATMPSIDTLHAFEAQARADFGEGADRFLQLYSAGSDSQARDASRTAFSYRNFYWQNFCWMRLQASTGKAPIYAYEFTHAPPIPARATYDENATDKFGAFHGSEIPYIFRTFGVRDWAWTEADATLADTISSYWRNFARTGDPNATGLPHWPRYELPEELTMEFGDAAKPRPIRNLARLAFWDAFYEGQRHRSRAAA
jgi:para-nitrobenzyl esterase